MDELSIQITIDEISERMYKAGKSADEIEDFWVYEAERVAQEIRDRNEE